MRTDLIQRTLLALVVGLVFASSSAQEVVWRIGIFDRASGEFRAQSSDYNDPKADPTYRVGKSKDSEDWQRFQAGPANGMAGGREHPFTVLFDLASPPRGVYTLRIAILYETPRLSHLRVDINGHTGLFYFHPTLDYGAGDWEGTFVPQTSVDSKTIDLPTEWLKAGENRIVLTALDDPATAENSLGAIAVGHSGIVYDALELTHTPNGTYQRDAISEKVIPTVFYRNVNGQLAEVVESYTSFATMPASGQIILRVDGKEVPQAFSGTESFGERRVEFDVPEWQGARQAKIEVRTEAKSRSFPVILAAAQKWTVLIVPHEHLDVGFTDYPEKVAELHSQSIDGVIKLMEEVPDFRWTLDGSWVADQYMAGRSADQSKKFLELIRAGKIVLPPEFANQHTGVASLEGLARSLYNSHRLSLEQKLPIGAAHITDVPSYSWSYASVLHDAGIKYFAAGSNSWRAPILLQGRWNEKSPFYWVGPDGGRVLMWYSRAYLQLGTLFGSPPRIAAIRDSLPVFLQAYSRPEYKADATIIFGTQLENTPLSPEQGRIRGEWQKQFAWPRLEYATFNDAMQSIEKQMGSDIPAYRGDFGPYWEDGFGSDAAYTAMHRENQQRVLTAEKLGAIPSLLNPDLRPDRRLLADAWYNMLMYDEHTWTYVGATTQPEHDQTQRQLELKRSRAIEAQWSISESIHRSWAQLESFLSPKENSLVVFNSLNWSRDGLVTTDLQDGIGIFDTVTGKQIPVETLQVGETTPLPGFGGGYRKIRFLAENVPALGYKLFALRSAKDPASVATIDGTIFENSYYRMTVDPASGSVSSIQDKTSGVELVDKASPYRFGAYVYVSGADDMPNNSLYRYGAALKPPKLTATAAASGRLVSARRVPFGTVIVLESSAPNTPKIETEITLCDGKKQIDFSYHVHKDLVLTKEAAYIAFPFAATKPRFGYETQNGWVNPAIDELAGGSREWYTVHHWARVSSDVVEAAIIPRDTPLMTFGDIVRGNWPTVFQPATGSMFSWLMTNYWGTNFAPAQGGDFVFRYSLVSGADLHAEVLTRAGWEAMSPLEVDQVNPGTSSGYLPSDQGSFLKISDFSVLAMAWKLAEDGDGSVLRLVETAGKLHTVNLGSDYLGFTQAWRCNLLEDKMEELKTTNDGLRIEIKPYEIVTLRLRTAPLPQKAVAVQ